MGIPFLNNIIIDSAGHVQFKTTAGVDAGKIDQVNNDLAITNAVGDILLGDGSSDVYIGNGINNVDIVFEQSGSIKADDSASNVTLTLGSSNTNLALISGSDINVTSNLNVTGNVGIGTTSPSAKLDVKSSSSNSIPFQVTNSSDTDAIFSVLEDGGGDGRARIFNAAGTLSVNLDSSGNSYLNGGNVGIGTTTPTSNLHVRGDNPVINIDDSNSTTRYAALAFTTAGGAWRISSGDSSVSGTSSNLFITRATDGTANRFVFDRDLYRFGVYDNTNTLKAVIRANGISYFDGGNVGIGTTTPDQELTINGGTESFGLQLSESDRMTMGADGTWNYIKGKNGNGFRFSTFTAGDVLALTNAGNVGIGTTSPGVKLDVDGDVRVSLFSKFTFANGQYIKDDGSAGLDIASISAAGTINFITNSTDKMVITPAGQVQFNNYGSGTFTGTATKNLAVDSSGNVIETDGGVVDGSGTTNYVSKWSDANTLTDSQIFDNGTNVGIGTTSPEASVHVSKASSNNQLVLQRTESFTGKYKIYTNSNSLFFYDDAQSALRLRIDANGDLISNNDIIIDNTAGDPYLKLKTAAQEYVLRIDQSDSEKFQIRDTTNSATRVTLDTSGNIGIGTDSPSTKLEVAGAVGNFQTTGHQIFLTRNGNNEIYAVGASSVLALGTNSAEKMRIDSSGNVGIGGTTLTGWANKQVVLDGGSNVSAAFVMVNDTTGRTGLDGSVITLSGSDMYLIQRESANMIFRTANTERMRIDSSGNIGIGTTNPETPLHVLTNTTDNASAMLIQNGSTGDASIKFNISGDTYSIGIDNSDSDKFKLSYGAVGTNDRIVVDTSGNVGIGQASPRGKFDVDGEVYVTTPNGIDSLKISDLSVKIGDYDDANGYAFLHLDSQDFKFTTDSVEVMRITSSGNVGIGTALPATNLHVYDSSGGATLKIESNTSNAYDSSKIELIGGNLSTGEIIFGDPIDSDVGKIIYRHDGNSLAFNVNASERMRIDSSGNVGIGTTSPQAKLEVGNCDSSGNIGDGNIAVKTNTNNTAVVIQEASGAEQWGLGVNSDGDFVLTDSGTERVRIDDNTGNFGIGTNAPAEKLVVSGSDDVSIRINSTKNGTWTTDQLLGAYEFYGNDASGAGAQIKGKIDCASLDQYGAGFHMRFFTTGGGVGTSAIERMRINSNGAVTIGKTAPSSYNTQGIELSPSGLGAFTRSGNVSLLVNRTGSDGQVVSIRNDNTTVGSISVSGSTTSYNTSSDYRLKENVVDMTGAIERIEQLKPKRFNFISNAEKTVDGFIAHEVQNIIPEAVLGEKDAVDEDGNPEFQGIDQSKIVPLLVGAIKELKAEIENLKLQINS